MFKILDLINLPKLNYVYRVELLVILAIVIFVLYIFHSLNLFKKQ
jgi:hypothetical protein